MKQTHLALAIAAAAMISQPVLATNGDHLIGLGAQARALGGTGTAAFFGSENALTNPALIGKMQGTEFAIGGTAFMPRVEADATTFGATKSKSDADFSVIPEVSLATRINDQLVFGLGIYGSAGMGVDYRDEAGLVKGYSNLQLMKFAPTLAFNDGNWGIGFAPVIQYGALDINYEMDPGPGNVGNGMSQSYGLGFNLGGYFDVTPALTLGLAYQSAIDMKYKDQISNAAEGFMLPNFGVEFGDNLEQPYEIKVGAAYTLGSMMYTADYKKIGWGSAKGYKDFNWEDQNVFALGAKYTTNTYWLGVGYNYGKDPIKKLSGADYASQATNMLNNHFFPAVVESHFTLGGGYSFSENLAVDMALTYAAQKTKTVDTTFVSQGNPSEHKVTHSQLGYTLSLRMNF